MPKTTKPSRSENVLFLRVPPDLLAVLQDTVDNLNKTAPAGSPQHSKTSFVLGVLYTVLAGEPPSGRPDTRQVPETKPRGRASSKASPKRKPSASRSAVAA